MFAQKLKWLRKAQTRFPMLASDQAGTLGEQLALSRLEALRTQLGGKAMVFPSLRVPKMRGNGKYEIDLLLVSEVAVLAIEVKHWGGRLSRARGQWIQERGTEQKTLVDPIPLNADKVEALHHWLKQRRIHVPRAAMHSLILLTHPQANPGPDLKKCAEVVELANLDALVQLRCGQKKRWFWQKKPRYAYSFAELVAALDDLPTWDRLVLYGGQVILGDLEYMAVPDVKASALQRKYIRHARAVIMRQLFPGIFFKARLKVIGWSGERQVYPLHPEAKLVFRPAGQEAREEISWLHVETLQLGWKDHSYYNER